MKSDDDVEKLFSWLQTPDIRYREFADAREIADTLLTETPRPQTAAPPLPTREALQARAETTGQGQAIPSEPASPPASPGPTVTRPADETEPTTQPPASTTASSIEPTRRPLDSVFNRLSSGRARDRGPTNGRPR